MARPRKPTHLKVVTGTTQPCRTNAAEPKPVRGRPEPPLRLNATARAAWAEATAIADRMGVLTEADAVALEFLASAVADFRAAHASLDRPLMLASGETASQAGERYYWTCGKGGPMRRTRPEIADIADADRRVQSWVTKFGMSPADRSRVSAAPPAEANPFASLG